MALWQIEQEAAGGDVAMIAADVIEPDEGESESVEAGVAIWGGQGGDGLLAADEESRWEDGGERVFEFGFTAEGFPTPVAVVAVKEEAELLGEGGAFSLLDNGAGAGVGYIDQCDGPVGFPESERFEFHFLARWGVATEDAARPDAAIVPGFEPCAARGDVDFEAVFGEYKRLFASLKQSGGLAGGDKVLDRNGDLVGDHY